MGLLAWISHHDDGWPRGMNTSIEIFSQFLFTAIDGLGEKPYNVKQAFCGSRVEVRNVLEPANIFLHKNNYLKVCSKSSFILPIICVM